MCSGVRRVGGAAGWSGRGRMPLACLEEPHTPKEQSTPHVTLNVPHGLLQAKGPHPHDLRKIRCIHTSPRKQTRTGLIHGAFSRDATLSQLRGGAPSAPQLQGPWPSISGNPISEGGLAPDGGGSGSAPSYQVSLPRHRHAGTRCSALRSGHHSAFSFRTCVGRCIIRKFCSLDGSISNYSEKGGV